MTVQHKFLHFTTRVRKYLSKCPCEAEGPLYAGLWMSKFYEGKVSRKNLFFAKGKGQHILVSKYSGK